MVVVSDSSVLTALLFTDKLHLLPGLFHEIHIVRSVYKELVSLEKYGFKTTEFEKDWIKVVDFQATPSTHFDWISTLDKGEIDSILFSLESKADIILIDEKKGREAAKQSGIRVLGTLGILLEFKKRGLIPSLKPLIEVLVNQLQFRLSPSLILDVLKKANEL